MVVSLLSVKCIVLLKKGPSKGTPNFWEGPLTPPNRTDARPKEGDERSVGGATGLSHAKFILRVQAEIWSLQRDIYIYM